MTNKTVFVFFFFLTFTQIEYNYENLLVNLIWNKKYSIMVILNKKFWNMRFEEIVCLYCHYLIFEKLD